jgi:NAD(P)-dependent dehydrogenase (short-subunit alcohol dehydrogenase family)
VTGCSSGIGAAIAGHVISQGHRLAATARRVSALSTLPAGDSSQVLKLALDVSDKSSIDAAVAATVAHFGRIDVVCNVAGINTFGHAEAVTEQRMREIMETNFWGPMHLTRAAVSVFRDVNPQHGHAIGGTVVNVSSIGGRCAYPNHAPYHSSKFALEGFSEALASELDPRWNIRMLILEPGGTKSEFTKQSVAAEGVPRHPAYADPKLPVNLMLEALMDPALSDGFVEAESVAKTLFEVLQGEELPLRLPTGKDAFSAIKGKEMAKMEELEKWRKVSEGVGGGSIPG